MIIKFYDLKKNINKNKYFLLYGSNKGLIQETLENTLKPNLSKNIYLYDEIEILKNIDNFRETMISKSFFEDKKLIIINRVTDKIIFLIEEIIEKKIEDIEIVLTTDILEKKSKLRNFFEKNKNTIIVAFYEDNFQTLNLLAQNFFNKNNIKLSQQNINLIIERSSNDRIYLKNELEKIKNYYNKRKNISTEDIIKLTNLAENFDIAELIDNCLIKNKKKIQNIINENNFSSEDNILLLRTFLNKLKRLHKIKLNIETNKNTEEAISAYRPPIFWKDKEFIRQQIKTLSKKKIQEMIVDLNKLEILIKRNPQISNYLINDFILENTNH